MDLKLAHLLMSLGAGLLGVAVTWGIIRQKQMDMERRVDAMSKNVVYKDTCEKCKENQDDKYENLATMLAEVRQDVKGLIRTENRPAGVPLLRE